MNLKSTSSSSSKPDLSLIPLRYMLGVARVMTHGAKKYERENWAAQSGPAAVIMYVAAALRHMAHVQEHAGALDHESGLPHLDHAIASLLILRGILTIGKTLPADPERVVYTEDWRAVPRAAGANDPDPAKGTR